MTTMPSVAFRFSQEELVALYRAAVKSDEQLPYDELLPHYSAEERALALDVAHRGLIARGALEPQVDGSQQLNDFAVAAAAAGLFMDPSLRIMRLNNRGRLRTLEFYDLDETTRLAHAISDLDLHEYAILNDDAVFRAALEYSSGLSETVSYGGQHEPSIPISASLSQAQLESALASGRDGSSAAPLEVLVSAGIAEESASVLADALSGPCELITVVKRTPISDGVTSERALSFVQGGDACWQIGEPDENGNVSLQGLSGDAALEIIGRFSAE